MTNRRLAIASMVLAALAGCSSSDELPVTMTTATSNSPEAAGGSSTTSVGSTLPEVDPPPTVPPSSVVGPATTADSVGEAPTPSTIAEAPIAEAPITTVDITTDEGRLTVGGQLPDDLDPLVVVPDDFEVIIGSFTEISTGVTGASNQAIDDLVDFYVVAFEDVTGAPPVVERVTDEIVQIIASSDDRKATIILSPGPAGSTSITIAVER